MAKHPTYLNDTLYDYLLSVSSREAEILKALREETQQHEWAIMQITPDQGQFMGLLVKLTGARRILEIGTYTGYSALAMALALPPDGEIIACDISEEWTTIARRYWQRAGVAGRIRLRLAPALETLDQLLAAGEAARFDLAFIDADKENYAAYYERVLRLLRSGGVVLIDNVLWNGSVIDSTNTEASTLAIRNLNSLLQQDSRVDISMLAVGDGLTLARKR